jgi:hypothetical protein
MNHSGNWKPVIPVVAAPGSSFAGGGALNSTELTPSTAASFLDNLGSEIVSPPADQNSKPATRTE